jgi:hypothetical protein
MNFCAKCGTFVKRTVVGACVVCGVALGSPAIPGSLHGGAAAASITSVTPGHPLFAVGRYTFGKSGDSDDPGHGEFDPTFDGPAWDYSSTATTMRTTTPPLHDD